MRTFQLLNVVKVTDNETVANRYLELGYKEVLDETEDKKVNVETKKENETETKVSKNAEKKAIEDMKVDELKAYLDANGVKYASNAHKDVLFEIAQTVGE